MQVNSDHFWLELASPVLERSIDASFFSIISLPVYEQSKMVFKFTVFAIISGLLATLDGV